MDKYGHYDTGTSKGGETYVEMPAGHFQVGDIVYRTIRYTSRRGARLVGPENVVRLGVVSGLGKEFDSSSSADSVTQQRAYLA